MLTFVTVNRLNLQAINKMTIKRKDPNLDNLKLQFNNKRFKKKMMINTIELAAK